MRRGSARPSEVAGYLCKNKQRLLGGTRDWNKTWYDSTLPYWLLDRSFIPIDCIATPDVSLVRQRPPLRVGGCGLLSRNLYARLALCPGPGTGVPRA